MECGKEEVQYLEYFVYKLPHCKNTLYIMVSEVYATLISCTVYVGKSIELYHPTSVER